MAIRPILEVPDPRLKQVSRPVTAFDETLRELVADMFETMYDAPGIGLAAVQVGVPLRVLVIDLQDEVDPDVAGDVRDDEQSGLDPGLEHRPRRRTPRVFVNPEVLDPSPELSLYNEGCLSLPDIYGEVERPATIRARWQDLDGERHETAIDGLLATCLQHEMDHLEGILFVDRLSRLKRGMALKKLEKARKGA